MNHLSSTGLLACVLSFFLATVSTLAQSDTPGAAPRLDLSDRELFPEEFFPDLSELSEEELLLAGLRTFYPQRILTELPDRELPEPAEPVVREMDPSGVYIRVTHLGEALPVIRKHLAEEPLVVIDFRFLATDLDSTFALGALLTRRETVELRRAGDYPVPREVLNGDALVLEGEKIRRADQTIFTLSNHRTRGPLEALLAQLTIDGEIISVGAPSPGETAAFRPFPGYDSFYIINGEIRPAGGASLTQSGFIPRVRVRVNPNDDEIGYRSLRAGVSLDDLVQRRADKPRPGEADEAEELPGALLPPEETVEDDEPPLPQDTILQRALNIVKALQALGKIES